MPVLAVSPYDTADTALNFARVHANDAGLSLAGSPLLLGDLAPGTFTLLNTGWRMLQRVMTNYGIGTFVKTAQMLQVPLAGTSDPGIQMYIGFMGTFDGVQMHQNPHLPPDMAGPLRLWERQSGAQQRFIQMAPSNDGMPSRAKTLWLRVWTWETDVINLVGSTQVNDIQIRYNSYLPDIEPDIQGLGSTQIPLLRCADALGAFTAAAFGAARGSQATAALMSIGDAAVRQMAMTAARQQQRGNHRRRAYSSRDCNGGYGSGWGI
jgi:hypothetical protein